MPTVDSIHVDVDVDVDVDVEVDVEVDGLEAQAYAAMQKMEKQRLWRWALRGVVIP